MATVDQLSNALIKADAAGDTEGATILAREIKRLQAAGTEVDQGTQPSKGARVRTEAARETQQAPEPGSSMQDYINAGMTWLEGAGDLPVLGPALTGISDFIGSNVSGLVTGEDPAQIRADVQARREARKEQYPLSNVSGQIAGTLATMGGVGATAAGAEALGMTGAKLLPRVARSAGSNALISGADTAARGGDIGEVAASSTLSGGIGAAIPVAGRAIERGISAAADRIYPTVNAALRPEQEAARRVGSALMRDTAANPASVMNAADEATARSAGVPIVNADRGGETTRALARSVANQSPEARETISRVAQDRFSSQSQRATDFIRKLTGGDADDLAARETIRETARHVNKPAYDRAFSRPEAQAMWNEGFSTLMQAPAMRTAARMATTRGANRAAVEGFRPVSNPFTVAEDGSFVLRANADGSRAMPTLQFWDQTKRNLDGMIGKAQRAGDNPLVADLTAIKNALVRQLDGAVPSYKAARQGAAAFFDAEDALDAGRKFAVSPRSIPEARKALERFTPPERKAFATGFASELIDRIKAAPDRANVISSYFKSDAARESMEMAFGKAKAKEIEAYVRVEDLADRLRGAMGNSTTARQLAEMGLAAGAGGIGGYALTGDWKGALAGAVVPRATRYASQQVEGKVMQRMASMLMSDKRGNLQLAVQAAARNPGYMRALEDLGNALAVPARSMGVMYAQ